MELRQIASFLAVVEEGQFARAAARLFLSPAAVTGHVKVLERELGTRLLERNPVAVTAAGQRFIPHARAVLAAANAARAAATEPDPNPAGVLRVGVMGHGSAELTPAVLRAFRLTNPAVDLHIVELNFTQHVSALLEYLVDVAFVRPDPKDERITSDVLTREPRIVVVSRRSELASAGGVHLSDVLELPYVATPEGTPAAFTDYLHFTQARGGLSVRQAPDEVANPIQVLISVAAGRGTGSALYSFARYYHWPGTVCVPVLDAPWERSVLASRAGDQSPPVQAFRRLATGMAEATDWLAPPEGWDRIEPMR